MPRLTRPRRSAGVPVIPQTPIPKALIRRGAMVKNVSKGPLTINLAGHSSATYLMPRETLFIHEWEMNREVTSLLRNKHLQKVVK